MTAATVEESGFTLREDQLTVLNQLDGLAGKQGAAEGQMIQAGLDLLRKQADSLSALVKRQHELVSSRIQGPIKNSSLVDTNSSLQQLSRPVPEDRSLLAPEETVGPVEERSKEPWVTDEVKRERLLTEVFAVADTLEYDELSGVAYQTQCMEEAARALMNKMKGSVRNLIARLQKKAQAPQVHALATKSSHFSTNSSRLLSTAQPSALLPQLPSPPMPSGDEASSNHAVEASPSSPGQLRWHSGLGAQQILQQRNHTQQQQLVGLASITAPSGALSDELNSSISIIQIMQQSASYHVRSAVLSVLHATRPALLYRFVTTRMLELLELWLTEADNDDCITFLLKLLDVLRHLPIPLTMLSGCALLKSVARLSKNKSTAFLSKAASCLNLYWRYLLEGQRPEIAAARAGFPSPAANGDKGVAESEQPEVQHTLSAGAQLEALLPGRSSAQRVNVKPKPAYYSTKPLSADDIRKAKEKGRLKMQLQMLQQKEQAASAGHGQPSPSATGSITRPVPPSSMPQGRQAAGENTAPPAKRQAVEGDSGNAIKAAAGGPASTGAGADDDSEDLTPEAVAKLREMRQLRQRARQLSESVSKIPQHQREVASAVLAFEMKANERRKQRKERQQQDAVTPRQNLSDGIPDPCIPWSTPPEVHQEFWEDIGTGDDSAERQKQAWIADQHPKVEYASLAHVPHCPKEPRDPEDTQAVPAAAVVVPWNAADPTEMMQLNLKAWSMGVRIPGYVTDPALLAMQIGSSHHASAQGSSHFPPTHTGSQAYSRMPNPSHAHSMHSQQQTQYSQQQQHHSQQQHSHQQRQQHQQHAHQQHVHSQQQQQQQQHGTSYHAGYDAGYDGWQQQYQAPAPHAPQGQQHTQHHIQAQGNGVSERGLQGAAKGQGGAPPPPGIADVIAVANDPAAMVRLLRQHPHLLVAIKGILVSQNTPAAHNILNQLAKMEHELRPQPPPTGQYPTHGYPNQ